MAGRSSWARPVALVLALAIMPETGAAQTVLSAAYADPADHYRHDALGPGAEFSTLAVTLDDGRQFRATFPAGGMVFEDLAPRLWDLDRDGVPEVVVIEADPRLGARLAVWGMADGALVRRAATPHIGQAHRWLAPLGAADLDGDGLVEIAFVDRPHLARVLRIWRWQDGTLSEVAAEEGHTNHRFGAPEIGGGIRDCGDGPEIVTASADWTRIMAARLEGGQIASRDIGPWTGGFADALSCR
jgi:hypothetical protein